MSLLALPGLPSAEGASSTEYGWLKHEILVGGSAIFYQVPQSRQRPQWIVYCAPPDLQCVARTEGIALRIDEHARPWLFAMASRDARILVQQTNFVLDVPQLFTRPLTKPMVDRLSQKRSFLVIEEKGYGVWRVSTAGLGRILDYLIWVTDMNNRLDPNVHLRWSSQYSDLLEQENQTGQQTPVRQFIHPNAFNRLVPNDKPQSEFAIQSQGGHSFFSPSGRAGY